MDNASGATHILLAGQEDESRRAIESFLARAGWRFDFVPDGDQALQAAVERGYDVVITDWVMPGTHGVDLLRAIRQKKPGQAVIVVGASRDIDEALKILREGVSYYLQKPLDFDSFSQAVVHALSGVRRREDRGRLFRQLTAQSMEYEFSTAELAGSKISLPLLEDLYQAERIDLDTKLKLELGFQEALANSLEHGNLELKSEWKEQLNKEGIDRYSEVKNERLRDPRFADRMIRLHTQYTPHLLMIAIKDGGPGFLIEEYLSAREDPAKLCCYGRGMAMITNGFDEISYRGRGRELTMVKYLGGKR